jgi:hypothetical protein
LKTHSCVGAICTYTQGKYGNAGGKACDGTTGGLSTDQLIAQSLGNWGGTLTVGKTGHSLVINNTSIQRACLIAKMPGGGGSKELPAGDPTICDISGSTWLKNGRINNTLLAQTITLGLNMGITSPSVLGNLVLQGGVLATAKPDGGCGSNTPKTRVCNYNPVAPYNLVSVTNEYTYRTIDPAVVAAISGSPKTVSGLFALANDALANTDGIAGSENGVSLSAIAGAEGAINEVFDECSIFVGWNVAPCSAINPNPPAPVTEGRMNPAITTTEATTDQLSVTAYPNPFIDDVRFVIESAVSGQGSLDVYTISGQKLQTVYSGNINKGINQMINYRVPVTDRTTLIYVLRVGDKQAIGKLVSVVQ